MLCPIPLFPGCKKPVSVAIRTINGKSGEHVVLDAGDVPLDALDRTHTVRDEFRDICGLIGSAGSLKRVEDYLYEADFTHLDATGAETHFRERFVGGAAPAPFGFGCSVVRLGNRVGRAYDWKHDEAVTFVVRTPSDGTRFASVAVCSSPAGVTRQTVESLSVPGSVWSVLPFYATDGMNEHGVTCSVCVVRAKGDESVLWHGREFCAVGAVRQVLDRARTAQEGAGIIASEAWMPAPDKLGGYSLHFMITDASHTFIVEDGTVTDITDDNVKAMTNFRLGSRSFLDEAGFADVSIIASYDPFGTGVERYNELVDYVKSASENVGMREWLTGFVYSDAYRESLLTGSTTRPSDFAGTEISRDHFAKVNETEAIRAWFVSARVHEKWLDRARDGKFWQTVHSAVYDTVARTVSVVVQEGVAVHEFPLVRSGGGEGTVKSVNAVKPDASGDVSLTAQDIPYGGEDASDVETAIEQNAEAILRNAESVDSLGQQLAEVKDDTYTKDEVDDKINEFAAHYLTKRTGTEGHYSYPQFATHADLAVAKATHTEENPQFFYGDEGHTPDKNDYCVVLADETHGGMTSRYSFVGSWNDNGYFRYQYTINETALTQVQWDAVNSHVSRDEAGNLLYDGHTIVGPDGKILVSEDDPVFSAWRQGTSVAVGLGASASAASGVAVGAGARANSSHSVAIRGVVNSPSSVAIGPDSSVAAGSSSSVAIGSGAKVSAIGAVQLGYDVDPNAEGYSFRFRGTTVVNGQGKIPTANLDETVVKESDVADYETVRSAAAAGATHATISDGSNPHKTLTPKVLTVNGQKVYDGANEITTYLALLALVRKGGVVLLDTVAGTIAKQALFYPHMADDTAIRFDATGTLGSKVYTRSFAFTPKTGGGIAISRGDLTEVAKKSDIPDVSGKRDKSDMFTEWELEDKSIFWLKVPLFNNIYWWGEISNGTTFDEGVNAQGYFDSVRLEFFGNDSGKSYGFATRQRILTTCDVDKTLTAEGKAADAKATGKALDDKRNLTDLDYTRTEDDWGLDWLAEAIRKTTLPYKGVTLTVKLDFAGGEWAYAIYAGQILSVMSNEGWQTEAEAKAAKSFTIMNAADAAQIQAQSGVTVVGAKVGNKKVVEVPDRLALESQIPEADVRDTIDDKRVAIGSESDASGDTGESTGVSKQAVAVGRRAKAFGPATTAIGSTSVAGHTGIGAPFAVAIGYRAVAPADSAVAIGGSNQYNTDLHKVSVPGLPSVGVSTIASAESAIAIGGALAKSTASVVIGKNAVADENSPNSVAIGPNAKANDTAPYSVAIGYGAETYSKSGDKTDPYVARNVALGINAKSGGKESIQLGRGTNETDRSLQFRKANLFKAAFDANGNEKTVAAFGEGFPVQNSMSNTSELVPTSHAVKVFAEKKMADYTAPAWMANHAYSVGDVVSFNDNNDANKKLWRCIVAHTSGSSWGGASKWEQTTANDVFAKRCPVRKQTFTTEGVGSYVFTGTMLTFDDGVGAGFVRAEISDGGNFSNTITQLDKAYTAHDGGSYYEEVKITRSTEKSFSIWFRFNHTPEGGGILPWVYSGDINGTTGGTMMQAASVRNAFMLNNLPAEKYVTTDKIDESVLPRISTLEAALTGVAGDLAVAIGEEA